MLRCSVTRREAAPAEVEAAFARLGDGPGVYFGCDAGAAGLHSLQGTLLIDPAIALRVFDDGIEVSPLDELGDALPRHPAFAAFVAAAARPGGRPLAALRHFLAAFAGCEEAMLIGALRFDAHRLATPALRHEPSPARAPGAASSPVPLGVFFFAPALLRRDAGGTWRHVVLSFEGDEQLVSSARRRRTATAPIDGEEAAIEGRDAPVEGSDATVEPSDDFAVGAYADVVERAIGHLEGTSLVSLTLSQSFRRRLAAVAPAAAFARLRGANPAPATFFFDTGDGECVFGASPDLQLSVHGREVDSFPVCGTVARGHGAVGEADSFRQLFNEEVDAASLAICTDALRNDLAPLCVAGSLRLRDRRRPLALATVVHTVDRLAGRLREGIDAWDAIAATAAPVMVTGTPRRAALAAIEKFEASPRGWYGGLVAQVSANGDALVGTLLRAACIRDGIAEVRTGGDLVAGSDPQREEHESRIKAVSLWRALGLSVASELQAALADEAEGPGRSADRATPEAESLPRAVALCDAGDPFVQAVAETLSGLGLALDAAASTRVLVGIEPAAQRAAIGPFEHVVAIGDAAAGVLQRTGFEVRPIRADNGRPVRCVPTALAPWPTRRSFAAMRYATLVLAPFTAPPDDADWEVWLREESGLPLVLAERRRRIVCLLMRPESLLSEGPALEALRAAIVFASWPCTAATGRR